MSGSVLRLGWPASCLVIAIGFAMNLGPWLGDRADGPNRYLETPEGGRPGGEPQPWVSAEGSVVAYPGAEVVVGNEATGRVVRVLVDEGSAVRRGDTIAEIDADEWAAELREAEAGVAEAEADIRFFEHETRRSEALVARHAGAPQGLDADRHCLEAARARRDAALARRDRYRVLVARARITSPIDGVVTDRHVDPGEMLAVGDRVATVVDLNRLRVEAEVDEFDVSRVTARARVEVTAEGSPGMTWAGSVEEVPRAVVGRRLRPDDPGRPIDARVLAVKVALDGPTPLKLGQRVDVKILPPAADAGSVSAGREPGRDRP